MWSGEQSPCQDEIPGVPHSAYFDTTPLGHTVVGGPCRLHRRGGGGDEGGRGGDEEGGSLQQQQQQQQLGGGKGGGSIQQQPSGTEGESAL